MADARSHYEIDKAKLRAVLASPNGEAMQKVIGVQRRTLSAAKLRSPVAPGGGIMRNAHRAEPIRIEGNMIRTAITVNTNYAGFVHDGTKAHLIKPKTKRALSWTGAGGRVFANVVKHPGAPKRPWLLNAAEDVAGREGFTVTPG